MSISLRKGFEDESLERVLEDLLVRFVINCPSEDLSSIERVFFQIEEAHWFYQDFARVLNNLLPAMKMKQFTTRIIEQCPLIWRWGDPENALQQFGKYKSLIPVRGCALLNESLDKVLLVKGYESGSWGFPRGKISKDETDLDCALRELDEETGFDGKEYIDEDEYIERTIKGKNYKIYVLAGVPESTQFEPKVRNEIKAIEWRKVKSLSKQGRNTLFLVSSMMQQLQSFINRKKNLQTEEELKKQATAQLKKILGVGQPLQKSDPGRELLNMLQQVATTKQPETITDVKALPPGLVRPGPVGPAGPGGPLPFPLPVNPFMMPFPMPFPMPFMMPPPVLPGLPFPPPPVSTQRTDQKSEIFAPPPSELDKPHLALANKRSGASDSKELLSILKRPEKKDEPKDTKDEPKEKSGFLQSLFQKYKTDDPAPKKVTILQRPKEEPKDPKEPKETPKEGSASLLSILKRPSPAPATNGAELLDILKKPEPEKKESGDGSKELLGLLKKPEPENGAQQLLGLLKPKSPSPANGSQELLGLLKPQPQTNGSQELLGLLKPTSPPAPAKEDASRSLLNTLLGAPKQTPSPSQDLLSLLKPAAPAAAPVSTPSESTNSQDLLSLLKPKSSSAETDEFEDFEDLNEGYDNVQSSNRFKTYISSDDEEYL
ncbi:hypothetical protein OGAPHI_003096 [Ogataea philodendri]|uniref:Nudix hydrolase domain-containing protein n=1 Tax=Ogataea philodendri TaxID=1378263 RepID=A0A9P8P8V9_9ASCO|nr:uncharacterized protein OGAPHI_003096 [Ogataea philodendri]KAH3667447.1 hypothetical protein OGAPHI_003096 [Ogataea philodendri]